MAFDDYLRRFYLVSVHKGSNFSRKDAKAPRKKYQYVFITMTYPSAIFASWREFFFLDGYYLNKGEGVKNLPAHEFS
jgi:hypothetical protein